MKAKLKIVKIGGNVINNEIALDHFLWDFSQLEGPKILIHGGGKLASELNQKLNIPLQLVDGRRITSSEDLKVVTMVYAGFINKNICAKLQANNCNAIGLSGSDANCILAKKRNPIPIDFGWVGDVEKVDNKIIQLFLNNGLTPVFSAICHDGKGQILNTNADTIAAEIAISMSQEFETELIYCFEKQGVLKDISDENSIIENIDTTKYEQLKSDNTINEGMLPKVSNCFYALNNKVSKVSIGSPELISNSAIPHTSFSI